MDNEIIILSKKYPHHKKEIQNIKEVYCNLTNYFASIVAKGEFSIKDMFFQSVVNRTNQCISSANYCLINDLPFPLLNIIRQMIEIYAINEYILNDISNFDKAFFGKKDHSNPSLKLPNITTIVQKLDKKEPIIVKLYDEYSVLSHPNSRAVFSVFKGEERYKFSMSSYSRIIESKDAYHLLKNIGGLANRIFISSKKINPLDKYITLDEFRKINKQRFNFINKIINLFKK